MPPSDYPNQREIDQYTILADPHGHYVEFLIFEQGPRGEDELFMDGSIKWDGCSNWKFEHPNSYPLHFCGKGRALDFAKMIEQLYQWAAELLPEHRNDMLHD